MMGKQKPVKPVFPKLTQQEEQAIANLRAAIDALPPTLMLDVRDIDELDDDEMPVGYDADLDYDEAHNAAVVVMRHASNVRWTARWYASIPCRKF